MHPLIWPVIWVVCGLVIALIAEHGQSRPAGCMPLLLFGPLGVLMLGIVHDRHRTHDSHDTPSAELKSCRFCTALIPVRARVCGYCQRDLPQDWDATNEG